MNGSAQSSHSLLDVKQDAELHGLTAALETLTLSLEERFCEELSRFEKKWAVIEDVKSTEELFSNRCVEFLERLAKLRESDDQANEIAVALYHPSSQTNFSRIFRRAKLAGNVRSLPSPVMGKALIDLTLSLHLLENKWVDNKSVSAFSNACKHLGSSALTERFWTDNQLGSPLVGRGFTVEKGLLDKAYKRLVHALFLYEGFFKAKEFIVASLDPDNFLEIFAEEIEFDDAKTLLQEYAQEMGLKPPSYQYNRDPMSPDHDPIFRVTIQLPNLGEISVDAKSKKDGSRKLAEIAIIELRRHKGSRNTLMYILAKKSASVEKDRRPFSTRSIPQEVFDLEHKVNAELGLKADCFRLMQALKTKSKGRSRHSKIPDNEIISRIGAIALECAIVFGDSEFRHFGVEGIHPRICDIIVERFNLKRLSQSIYDPIHDWGVNSDRQMAQALIFAVFINDQENFFVKMRIWLKAQSVFLDTTLHQSVDKSLPEKFDEKFSYVTVLQEYTQKKSTVLPTYSKITTGPVHAATHTAICKYEGNSTKGSSSRFNWAKNAAAFQMLQKLGFWEGST